MRETTNLGLKITEGSDDWRNIFDDNADNMDALDEAVTKNASTTEAGRVNTGEQEFAGTKTFTGLKSKNTMNVHGANSANYNVRLSGAPTDSGADGLIGIFSAMYSNLKSWLTMKVYGVNSQGKRINFYDEYKLPETAADKSANNTYNILTTKAVTLDASSQAAARGNISAASDADVANLADGMAIMANGNTHAAVAASQAVYVRNHSTLADGLYWASTAIATNATLSTSNLTADTSGGLNKLKGDIDSLNSNSVALARHTRKTDFALADLQAAVAEQNLAKYGLKPGDQKTINGYTYVIAGLNEMKGTHSYTCTSNHVALIVIPHTTQAWNASGHTYEGADERGAGYLNSDLHYYLTNTVLPHVQNDLGSGHLYAHRKILTNAVNQTGYNRYGTNCGCSSGWTWTDPIYIAALSEVQVYGAAIWSSSGYDTGEACKQLAVFEEYKSTDIFGSEYPWLRDVVSASFAASSYAHGGASTYGASHACYVAGLILYH